MRSETSDWASRGHAVVRRRATALQFGGPGADGDIVHQYLAAPGRHRRRPLEEVRLGALLAALTLTGMLFPVTRAPADVDRVGPGYNPEPGAFIVNPRIDCDADVEGDATPTPAGIIVDDPDTTIINPEIVDCMSGVLVRKRNGATPDNVRIIASAAHPGYTDTNFTHNRNAINVQRVTNLEVGDVSVPDSQVGGEMLFWDNFHPVRIQGGVGGRIHHSTIGCDPCSTYDAFPPGAQWGIKMLANRTYGAPQEVSGFRIDHNGVDGFTEEGIGFDSQGNAPGLRTGAYAATVERRRPAVDRIRLSGFSTTEDLVGQFIVFNDGGAQGQSVRILTRSGQRFTVADPTNVLRHVERGDRVTIGMRFFDNLVDHNLIDAQDAKTGIGFHGSHLFGRIEANVVTGTPSYDYPEPFHIREPGRPQCIMVRSMAGPGVPMFSMYNSVVDNRCEGQGDITLSVISWGTYEVWSRNWARRNSFADGRVWRYRSPQPDRDPTA